MRQSVNQASEVVLGSGLKRLPTRPYHFHLCTVYVDAQLVLSDKELSLVMDKYENCWLPPFFPPHQIYLLKVANLAESVDLLFLLKALGMQGFKWLIHCL